MNMGSNMDLILQWKELIHVCPKNDRGKTGAERDVREEEDSLSQNYLWRIWFYLSNKNGVKPFITSCLHFRFLIKIHFQRIQIFRNFIEKYFFKGKIKVNSVREAFAKCFVIHILKFEILQTTWKIKTKNTKMPKCQV